MEVLESQNYLCHSPLSDLRFSIELEESGPNGKPGDSRFVFYSLREIATNQRKSADGIFDLDSEPIAESLDLQLMSFQQVKPASWLPDGRYMLPGGNFYYSPSVLVHGTLETQFPDFSNLNIKMPSFQYLTFGKVGSNGSVILRLESSIQFEKTGSHGGQLTLAIDAGDSSADANAYEFYHLQALPTGQRLLNLKANCDLVESK